MTTRAASTRKDTGKKANSSSAKKKKKNLPIEDVPDPRQEEIDGLIREREEIRSKLNTVCSKIMDNVDIENYNSEVDLTKQQPSDLALDNLLSMIDELAYYRTAFLNLFQETEDNEKIPVQKRITQLSIDEPNLFRKHLTANQRLTFVARERDVWKENAQLLQIMYATVVDQLEMGIFKKLTPQTTDILKSHRLNLENVCLIFSAPNIRSITDAQKMRTHSTIDRDVNGTKEQHSNLDLDMQDHHTLTVSSFTVPSMLLEEKEDRSTPITKNKRTVSFSNEVSMIHEDHDIVLQPTIDEDQVKEKLDSPKSHLPLARDTLVEKMDSNLRMLIIKELSKDNCTEKPPSKMSANYYNNIKDFNAQRQQYQLRRRSPDWVVLARLIKIDESEIDHWLSQSLQYPAGRVLSTWCNSAFHSPNVAELHSVLSAKDLNRVDLARQIEFMYTV